ncbi:MAG: hypothetical protein QOH31_5460, partial [Verrucomicrobiota bacterium]
TLGPRLLAAFGTDRERFQSPLDAVTFFGVAPVTEQSLQMDPHPVPLLEKPPTLRPSALPHRLCSNVAPLTLPR